MRRRKADPRQLCFVFDDGRNGTKGHLNIPDHQSGGGSSNVEIDEVKPQHSHLAIAELPEDSVTEVEESTGLPPSIAEAYRKIVPLSGPDPRLTSLCVRWLKELELPDLARKVTVVWNRRFTSAAGVARYAESRIELNPSLVEFEGEVDRTLKHELAHLIARNRYPNKRIAPHGREWRQACAELGIPGEGAYHDLPFKTRKRKRNYAYQCNHCLEILTRVRPLKGYCACYACCKRYNRGQYHSRFQLIQVPVPECS